MRLSKEDKAELQEIQQGAIKIAREDGGLMLFMGHVWRRGLRYTCIQCKRNENLETNPGASNLRCPDCEPEAG